MMALYNVAPSTNLNLARTILQKGLYNVIVGRYLSRMHYSVPSMSRCVEQQGYLYRLLNE